MDGLILSGPDQHAIEQRIMTGTRWLGVPALKNPVDAWVYQEIIWDIRPDVVVEVGNHLGGSLLYLATILDLVGHGEVIGVDRNRGGFHIRAAEHPRVRLVNGQALKVFRRVSRLVRDRSVLVIEDSDHGYDHTLAVLRTYGALVQPGGYMICEDGVMDSVRDALDVFTAETDAWEADRAREWPMTWNPGGYLRRMR